MNSSAELALQHVEDIQGYKITASTKPAPPPTDSGLHLFSSSGVQALYKKYGLQIVYHRLVGKLGVPLAGEDEDGNTQDIIQVAKPRSFKTVTFSVEREGLPPELPAVEEDSNQQLLESVIIPYGPTVTGDARTRVYRVDGLYLYALRKPVTEGVDEMPQGHIPALSSPPPAIKPEHFKTEVTSAAS